MNVWARKNKQTGFTIVELLIVIVVIAILAAVTIVAYNGMRERAEAAAFVSAVDAYEKEMYMYAAENGRPYTVPSQYQATQPQPGYAEVSMESCVPSQYPAQGEYAAGDCTVMYTTFTYDGDAQPSYHHKTRYKESTALRQEMEVRGALARLPSVPSINDFKVEYSNRETITATEAQSWGMVNPRDGSGTWRIIQASRGLIAVQGSASVQLMYYLKGDQVCGRGQRQLVDIGASIAADPTAINYSTIQKLTVCSITVR